MKTTEENSKLISDLYNATDKREITDILEYMGGAGNDIFVYPILDGYKKHKDSSIGYYFIWNLSRLDYPNLGKRLNELLETYEVQKEHIPMTLFFMAERRFFSEIANKMAAMYMEYSPDHDFRRDFDLNGLGLSCVLDYMYKADILSNFEQRLRELIFFQNINDNEKAVILSYLLDICPEKQIDFLIENYQDKICGTRLENSLAKELLLCQTENMEKLREIIIKNGTEEAVKILSEHNSMPAKKKGRKGKTIYNSRDVVIKIGIFRDQINKKALANEKFGFQVFPYSELLIHQFQCIDDKNIFLSLCTDLIGIIETVNPQVRKHGFGSDEAQKLFGDIANEKGDTNLAHLYLFLSNFESGVDYNFFGLRELYRTLIIISGNREDEDFFEKLESIGIAKMYREQQWHKIHGYLLNSYLQSLDMINKVFN